LSAVPPKTHSKISDISEAGQVW